MANDANMMDWNDTLENDGQEFVVLPEGDYNFEVTSFERGRHPGSAKLPACNKAMMTLTVRTENGGIATCKCDLPLYRTMEWKLSSFFRCIGQKKHGEKLKMDWNRVLGSKGRAHFKPRDYEKDGETRQANEADKFYDYDPKFFPKEDEWMTVPDDGEIPWE